MSNGEKEEGNERQHEEDDDDPMMADESHSESTAEGSFVSSKKNRHEPIKTVGDLYVALGNPGKMAVIMFFALSFNFFSITTNHVVGVFYGYTPEHECHPHLDSGRNASSVLAAVTTALYDGASNASNWPVQRSRAWGDGHFAGIASSQACEVTFINGSGDSNLTRLCQPGEWRYKLDPGESSSVSEWDLVCDKAYQANLANTLYYVGVTIGGFCIAHISDTIGRKVAVLLSLYTVVLVGLGIVFCHNFVLFVCLRTLMGIAAQALMTTSYIQVVEMFPPAYRGLAGSGVQSFWGMAMVYLSLMAWALKDWRHIQLACTIPAMVSGIYLLFMPESLRWLLSRGKTKRAAHVARRIYRCNKATNRKCLDHHLLTNLSSKHTYKEQSIIDLCRAPVLRKNTIIFALVSFAINLGYWGFAYNTSKLVGNRYFNFFLGALAELAILTGNIYFVNRFGRKKPFVVLFAIGAACCIILAFLPKGSNVAVSTAAATLGRLAMSGLFSVGDLYATELFPTIIRTTGVSVCVLAGRAGAMVTPMIFTMGDYTFQQLPLLIFGGSSIGGCLLTLLLPETSRMELMDTIKETERTLSMSKGTPKAPDMETSHLRDMEGTPGRDTEKTPV